MAITLSQSRVKPGKTTRRLLRWPSIRALRGRRPCKDKDETRYRLHKGNNLSASFPQPVCQHPICISISSHRRLVFILKAHFETSFQWSTAWHSCFYVLSLEKVRNLSLHWTILSLLLWIYTKNAKTAIAWQNITRKTTSVGEIWARNLGWAFLGHFFFQNEVLINHTQQAFFIRRSDRTSNPWIVHLEDWFQNYRNDSYDNYNPLFPAVAWQIRSVCWATAQLRCSADAATFVHVWPTNFFLRQVKQWQAFLHEQAEIFLARPDLQLWQKAQRRSSFSATSCSSVHWCVAI